MTNDNPHPSLPPYVVDPQLDPIVRQVMGVVLRGLFTSIQGVPPERALASVSRQVASLCAEMIQGDLTAVLQVRALMKRSFEEGFAFTKPKPLPGPLGPPPGVTRQ